MPKPGVDRASDLDDRINTMVTGVKQVRPSPARQASTRAAILDAAEELFAANGFTAVSIRDIARAAGANPGSISYHFGSKDGLLLEIYRRHCAPMNRRRGELLGEALRVRDPENRLEAIVRAYIVPAYYSSADLAGGGARFTRLRAVMSAEGNEVARRIIADTFDETSHAFIDALHRQLPHLPRATLVWRSHFLLGALYYSLVTQGRVTRLSRGEADGSDHAAAIEEIVRASVAAFKAPAVDTAPGRSNTGASPRKTTQRS